MPEITALFAIEILDSRGVPTVEVEIHAGAVSARASVPSGKSTGRMEAHERRDGDPGRYGGRGVLGAIQAIETEIAHHLIGRPLPPQVDLDRGLVALDGSPNRSRLGANAILAVSLAGARLRAALEQRPLFASLGGSEATTLPVPCFNLINGGAHADNDLAFQEFMVAPAGLPSYHEALRAAVEVYHALGALLKERGLSTAVGDEGGFAPRIAQPEDALHLLVAAIERARYRPGEDLFLALDPAANGFWRDERYQIGTERLVAAELIGRYEAWLDRYPILSIEDGLAEDDRAGWREMTRRIGSRVQIVGDDIFVSNRTLIERGVREGLATAVLLKPNQVGTVTDTAEAAAAAVTAGWRTMMSHRSGETDDPFIAHLAVALGTGQIKSGATARGERVAKYNELLRIERALRDRAVFAGRPAFRSA